MKLSTVKQGINVLARHPKVYFGQVQYLFILSHMRSYSSLLAHILGSHSQIVGHIERLCSYTDARDLMRFRHHSFVQHGRIPNPYLLDKILHNRFVLADDIINRDDVKLIVLLREPEPTIKSIINMMHVVPPEKDALSHQNPMWALDHYTSRLAYLEACIKRTQSPVLFLDAKDIIQHTEIVLMTLARWLQLETDLNRQYRVFPETGVPGKGDPSDVIKTGSVLTSETDRYDRIEVPEDMLDRARAGYVRSRDILRQHCDTVDLTSHEPAYQ